jgi:hypothetical protein
VVGVGVPALVGVGVQLHLVEVLEVIIVVEHKVQQILAVEEVEPQMLWSPQLLVVLD